MSRKNTVQSRLSPLEESELKGCLARIRRVLNGIKDGLGVKNITWALETLEKYIDKLNRLKPGPKPKNIERDIAQRVEAVRLQFGVAASQWTSSDVLKTACCLLEKHNAFCESNLFLTDFEIATVEAWSKAEFPDESAISLQNELEFSRGNLFPAPAPSRDHLIGGLRDLSNTATSAEKFTWRKAIEQSYTGISKDQNETQIFKELALVMGYRQGEFTTENIQGRMNALRRQRPRKEEKIQAKELELARLNIQLLIASGYDDVPTKIELLRVLASELSRTAWVLHTCRAVEITHSVVELYSWVRSLAQISHIATIPPLVLLLDTLFLEALNRQSRKPFPIIFEEEIDIDPPGVPLDGEQLPLKGRDSRKAPKFDAKKVDQILKEASRKGMKDADAVKKLMKETGMSRAHAYRAKTESELRRAGAPDH